MKNKKMKNGEFRKFESFEELKSSKSESSERTEEQILKSHRDFEIFIEELRKNIVPNENLKKAYKRYKDKT